jgi:hypothetical protein
VGLGRLEKYCYTIEQSIADNTLVTVRYSSVGTIKTKVIAKITALLCHKKIGLHRVGLWRIKSISSLDLHLFIASHPSAEHDSYKIQVQAKSRCGDPHCHAFVEQVQEYARIWVVGWLRAVAWWRPRESWGLRIGGESLEPMTSALPTELFGDRSTSRRGTNARCSCQRLSGHVNDDQLKNKLINAQDWHIIDSQWHRGCQYSRRIGVE